MRLGLIAIAVFVFSFFAHVQDTLADETEWGYTGETGPKYWGEMAPEFAMCAEGFAQSPIDIRDPGEVDLVDIEFQYGQTDSMITNNGHTIQVNVDAGSSIVYNGITYNLLQFHFHAPSEHKIDGVAAPMEIHFVHLDPNSGTLAVVGVMLTQGESRNEAYAAVFDYMPAEAGEPQPMDTSLSLASLLPDERGFYTYQGSLTTPPCSEIVRWLLLDTPVELSAEQIDVFAAIYSDIARPVQPLGKRDLLQDSP